MNVKRIPPELCVKCRGSRMLCGLSYCPLLISMRIKNIYSNSNNSINGDSPPSVFIGRHGYPKVNVYPSAPPVSGDTSIYENENAWINMDINDFIEKRLSIYRGSLIYNIDTPADPDYKFQEIQMLSMSSKPVNINMSVLKPFKRDVILDENISPMGPSSPLKDIYIGNSSIDNSIERAYYDTDFKADDAMIYLYKNGKTVNEISKILSTGSIGTGRMRRMVPTRWAITAADKNISDYFVDTIKNYNSIDKIELYLRKTNGNLFIGILMPGSWSFEWGESWFPDTTWNRFGGSVAMELDYENYNGRKTYPDIGGCYYSSRLAVSEYLNKRRRQAVSILWREIYPGFNLPVGVWYVRDHVRELFKSRPVIFDDINDLMKYLSGITRIDVNLWKVKSKLIGLKRLDSFFGGLYEDH
ncbi:Nre family DNA repair protein [Picrophilus oshimae]|uniref:DNA repair protein n=1 Tax=Picrophilus torridus (strain ATCC 700027 / DSM 9790 / JCM 10055 / NBRC 100828 / KAW 2/3) TaxID=1122961 RepID=Q6KYW6_PICTO|nr:Nre family DNA repair protein [Picrophilus oshimae]AAT44086.1 conserved archaeal hypothetic protein [Picrophilus oshimae DSM 9789]